MRLTLFLLFLSSICFGQDVIDFKLLYEKNIKSTANFTVSDNSIDFKNIDHHGTYYVRFIGEYPKRLLLKNLIGGKFIFEGGVTAATDNKTLQIANCKRVLIDLTYSTITGNGASSGVCGQLIYIYDKWQDITIKGGKLHQNGSSGGAAFQVESYNDPSFSHGTLIIDGLNVTQAMGEGVYIGYNQPTKAYLDTLIIRNTNITNTRRDFWQWANVRHTIIEDNKGDNGALEMNSLHISGMSCNGKNDKVIIRRNTVSRVPQFIFSDTKCNIELDSNIYIQGNHAGARANQAIYTKSPMTLTNNVINTPAAKEAVITVDGSTVNWNISDLFIGPKAFRYFNGGKSVEFPYVQTRTTELTVEVEKTSTYEKVFVIYNGQRIQIK